MDAHIAQVLTTEASFSPVDPYSDIARLDFKARFFMLQAALALNPTDGFSQIVAQHSTVVTNAATRNATDRWQTGQP